MLTIEQIKKVSRLVQQTGGYEQDWRGYQSLKSKHIIRIKLVYKELKDGNVVIQKK